MNALHSVDTVEMIDRYEYHWCDGVNYKKPTKLPASQYVSLLMDWVEQQINNEEIFPVTVGWLLTSLWSSAVTCCLSASLLNSYFQITNFKANFLTVILKQF